MSKIDSLGKSTTHQVVFVVLLALLLYGITLAPTVLWGDDAELQRLAIQNETRGGVRNYWLWVSVAHQFAQLPYGDMAGRVNLVSAVFAAGTIGVVLATLRLLTCSTLAAWAGTIALALSHTFWLHAVRAEVYSLFLFILALAVALLAAWHQNATRHVFLALGLLCVGLAFSAHLLTVTFLPAVAALVIGTKKRNAGWIYALAVMALVSGLLPYLITSQGGRSQIDVLAALSKLLQIRARDVLLWLGFLGYQFLLLMPVGIVGVRQFWRTDRMLFWFLGLAFCGNVAFALSHQVPDQYVFYLPSYLIFALWIGKGVDVLQKRFLAKPRHFLAAILMVGLLPLPVYRLTPVLLNQLNLNLLSVRTLPNRDNNLFFFYPPKNGYDGARLFGETVMKSLPADAAVMADWLPFQTLIYFQVVEGMRPDVLLTDTAVYQGQLAWLLQQSETRPVFIADNERYYDMVEISQEFEIEAFGPIFRLQRNLEEERLMPATWHRLVHANEALRLKRKRQ